MAAFLSGIADVDLMSMSNLHAALDIQARSALVQLRQFRSRYSAHFFPSRRNGWDQEPVAPLVPFQASNDWARQLIPPERRQGLTLLARRHRTWFLLANEG